MLGLLRPCVRACVMDGWISYHYLLLCLFHTRSKFYAKTFFCTIHSFFYITNPNSNTVYLCVRLPYASHKH